MVPRPIGRSTDHHLGGQMAIRRVHAKVPLWLLGILSPKLGFKATSAKDILEKRASQGSAIIWSEMKRQSGPGSGEKARPL